MECRIHPDGSMSEAPVRVQRASVARRLAMSSAAHPHAGNAVHPSARSAATSLLLFMESSSSSQANRHGGASAVVRSLKLQRTWGGARERNAGQDRPETIGAAAIATMLLLSQGGAVDRGSGLPTTLSKGADDTHNPQL